jgi:hypothetical protein
MTDPMRLLILAIALVAIGVVINVLKAAEVLEDLPDDCPELDRAVARFAAGRRISSHFGGNK